MLDKSAVSTDWSVGNVVEIAPNLYGRITAADNTELGMTYTYELVAVAPTTWERIKLFFGWRPVIGY